MVKTLKKMLLLFLDGQRNVLDSEDDYGRGYLDALDDVELLINAYG